MSAAARTVGLVGIGGLGFAIAKNLIAAGHTVVGYRRSSLEAFVAAGGTAAASPRAVAEASDLVLTCLPDAAALDAVATGANGLAAAERRGLLVAELSTIAATDKARARSALIAAGGDMIDGAITGNPYYVARRAATVFVGGEAPACARAEPVLAAGIGTVRHVGGFGAGVALKLLASLLVPVHTLAAAEALQLGMRAGLAPDVIFDAIAGGQASSAMFESRGKAMATRDYGAFPASLAGYLENNIAMTEALARSVGGRYPLLEAMAALYREAVAAGAGERDQATIFEYLMREGTAR